jgi:glycosyltransferase involved in cell wall biosynthesis
VAIEALACETPVVVSDDGGLKEFIDEKVGQVFKSEDSSDLAEKLLFEINNNAKEKKGFYAASYALNNFSWYSVVDNVIDLYQKVTP